MNEALENTLRIKYLLGQATEEESLQVEESYFQSPDYYESMLALEEELIRQYLKRELTPEQSAQFESHFLATERRQKKFENTRNLIEHINYAHPAIAAQALATPTMVQRAEAFLKSLSGLLVWNTQVAAVALALLLLAGGVFYASLQRKHGTEPIAHTPQAYHIDPSLSGQDKKLALNSPAPETEKIEEPRGRTENQLHPNAPRATTIQKKQARNTLGVVINLLANRNNDEQIIELRIPAKSSQVLLNIPLEEPEYPKYKIIVKDTEGAEIVHHGDIKPIRSGSQWNLLFPLPTERLTQADYVINLYGISENSDEKLISEGFFHPKFQK